MRNFPHRYTATARGGTEGTVRVAAAEQPELETTAPPEFGGPEGYWSPEHLLVAAVADCFILSFRAVAEASRLPWESLQCDVEGMLDRVERNLTFTEMLLHARLTIPASASRDAAARCLDKAKRSCPVTNSLRCDVRLETAIGEGGAG